MREATISYVNEYLRSQYDSIFVIDLDTGIGEAVVQSKLSPLGQFNKAVNYSEQLSLFAETVDEPYREEWRKLSSLQYLRETLLEENHREYIYRRSVLDRPWRRATFQVAEKKATGEPKIVILTNIDVDMMLAEKLDVDRLVDKQKRQIIKQQIALEKALKAAKQASNAKSNFLFNMSHDIRTPMNAIIGFTTMALRHIDNQHQVKSSLEKVLAAGNHLLKLINDILDMSRIESGHIEVQEENCNIAELSHRLINLVSSQLEEKQQSLVTNAFYVRDEMIIADTLKLNQIFINLVSNAIKYTPAGGRIMLTAKQLETSNPGYGSYEFCVKDNGIGMSPEFAKRVFEPFEREMTSTRGGVEGTGLGLAITKNLVEKIGGHIEVETVKGAGSTFKVYLSFKLQPQSKDEQKLAMLYGQRALIVDSDPENSNGIQRMLGELRIRGKIIPFDYSTRSQFQEKVLNYNSYQYYILHWQSPMQDIIGVATTLRQMVGSNPAIIVVTDQDWSTIEKFALASGINEFYGQPFFMYDLKTMLLKANGLYEAPKSDMDKDWATENFVGKRLLLVEDNDLNREIAESILSEVGFRIETAADGMEAVTIMRQAPAYHYDAILMDIQMPIMNGYQATVEIRNMLRQDVKSIPIIAMTANAMAEDRTEALKNGMDDHIAKPIDIKNLLVTLKKHLPRS